MKEILYSKSFNHYLCTKCKDFLPIPSEADNSTNYVNYNIFESESHHNDEETFQREFWNPLYSLKKQYCTITLEKNDNKLALKLFYGSKIKEAGKSYYQVSRNIDFLSVNLIKGDIYYGHILDYQKKKKNVKYVRRNLFLNSPLNSFISKSKNLIPHLDKINVGTEVINEITELFLETLLGNNRVGYLTKEENLIKYHFDKKGIKYPNNFKIFMPHFYGKSFRKILVKNNNKLVESFMEHHKLQGGKLKKYLHLAKNLNIELYRFALNMFGENWLNQDSNVLLKILNSESQNYYIFNIDVKKIFTEVELKRVYQVFKKTFIDNEIDSYTFFDHIRIYEKLKKYGENIKWMSDGSDTYKFNQEHLDWFDKWTFYRDGTYTRIYPQYFYEIITTKINDFYPVILDQSEVYNEESLCQSNCVKNYISRSNSFVVSLRKGSSDSNIRATIEYKIMKDINGRIISNRVQNLGKYNSKLEDFWEEPLLKLDEKVLSCFRNKSFETIKIKKKCLNGVELSTYSQFDEKGMLIWNSEIQTKYFELEW